MSTTKATESIDPNAEDYSTQKHAGLQTLCQRKGLSTHGTRHQLITELQQSDEPIYRSRLGELDKCPAESEGRRVTLRFDQDDADAEYTLDGGLSWTLLNQVPGNNITVTRPPLHPQSWAALSGDAKASVIRELKNEERRIHSNTDKQHAFEASDRKFKHVNSFGL